MGFELFICIWTILSVFFVIFPIMSDFLIFHMPRSTDSPVTFTDMPIVSDWPRILVPFRKHKSNNIFYEIVDVLREIIKTFREVEK